MRRPLAADAAQEEVNADSASLTAVLILAAGSSSRLGRPKQLEVLGGETLLARAVRTAKAAALGPVYCIVHAESTAVVAEAGRLGCDVVAHNQAEEGIAASIRAGVQSVLGTVAGVLVMVCDQPMVTAQHLQQLTQADENSITASAYGGRHGVPAWFPASAFPQLLQLRGDVGARDLLRSARTVDLAGGEVDIDTDEDVAQIRSRLLSGESLVSQKDPTL